MLIPRMVRIPILDYVSGSSFALLAAILRIALSPFLNAVLLFQSARELLINTAKHAGTNEATLRLAQDDGILCVTVHQGRGCP